MASLTPFPLSLKPPPYNLPVLLHRPRSKLFNLPPESSNSSAPAARSFVVTGIALRVSPDQALPMGRVLTPHAIAVLDRRYNSLAPYQPPRPNLYAVKVGNSLSFRYVDFYANHLILRPHALDHPCRAHQPGIGGITLGSIVGRTCICIFRDISGGTSLREFLIASPSEDLHGTGSKFRHRTAP